MAQMQTEHKTDKRAGEVIGSVLNQAKDGLISFGETIANKSKEMVNTAKVNAQIAALQKENDENYIKLGKMVREKEEYTDEMREIGKKIDENEDQIKEIEAQQNDGESGEKGQDMKNSSQEEKGDNESSRQEGKASEDGNGDSKEKTEVKMSADDDQADSAQEDVSRQYQASSDQTVDKVKSQQVYHV